MSVADRRAAAKSAGMSMSDYKNQNPSSGGRVGPIPGHKPSDIRGRSPQPTPYTGSFPTNSGRMSVADRRAAAKSAGMSMSQYKSGGTGGAGSGFTNAQMAGNAGGAKGLVKARREAQKTSGLSMKAYKAGVSSGFINKHGEKNTGNGSGGMSNQFGGSAWDNLNANFDQSEWDAHVKSSFENYVKAVGLRTGRNGMPLN